MHKRRALRGPLNAASFLDAYADAFGDRPAITVDGDPCLATTHPRTFSYADVRRHAARLATGYAELGMRPGDRVAFLTPNRVELALALLGALRAGLIAVPLSALLSPGEITTALERSGARTLVTDTATAATVGLSTDTLDRVLVLGEGGGGHTDAIPFPGPRGGETRAAAPHPVAAEDPALIVFTSGTTGEPKGAVISHGALGSIIERYRRIGALLPTPRHQLALLVMPLAHTAGFVSLVTTLCLGIPSLVLSRFDARGVLETIERDRPTIFAGSPAMYRMLLEGGAEGYDLSSIRIWGGGADVFDRELLCTLRDLGGWRRWGLRLRPFTFVGYGASETTGQVTISPPVPIGDRCVGWVLPGFRYRITDTSSRDVPRGATGELRLRGRGLLSGYWEDAEQTRTAIQGGWFKTGDLVRRGRLGLLYFEGRLKDVITSGGYTIAAAEIERALEAHPAVDQAAAVGLPDTVKGERPAAAVALRPGARGVTVEELECWAADRLAAFKRPREIRIVPRLPLSATLKPRKPEIRDLFADPSSSPRP